MRIRCTPIGERNEGEYRYVSTAYLLYEHILSYLSSSLQNASGTCALGTTSTSSFESPASQIASSKITGNTQSYPCVLPTVLVPKSHIYNMQFDSYQDTAPDSRPQTQPQAGTPSCTSQHNIVINDCMYQHGLLTV